MRTIRLTRDELDALLAALEAFTVDPPVVPDLSVYERAVKKLRKASRKVA